MVEFINDTATIDKTSGDTSIGRIDIDKVISQRFQKIKHQKTAIRVLKKSCEYK